MQGPQKFMKVLIAMQRNASPARLPTAIPMMVESERVFGFDDDASDPEPEPVLEPVAPEVKIFVDVCSEPSAAVIVASTVAGSGSAAVYPFS